jgi:hypothetical protein
MARSYSRNGRGQFSISDSRKKTAAEKKRVVREEKRALSGGKLGGRSKKRANNNKKLGKGASTKAVRNALARARSRFT